MRTIETTKHKENVQPSVFLSDREKESKKILRSNSVQEYTSCWRDRGMRFLSTYSLTLIVTSKYLREMCALNPDANAYSTYTLYIMTQN